MNVGAWILPKEPNLPQVGDLDPHHGVKLIEDNDIDDLQDKVNLFLLTLESSLLPRFFLYDIQFYEYRRSFGPIANRQRHVAAIRLMSFGEFNLPT